MHKKARSEHGYSLIEVLVSIALIAIIAVAFTMALTVSSRSLLIADERNIAESLAKSQIEYIKNQEYVNANDYVNDEAIYLPIDTSEYPSFAVYSENRTGEVASNIIGIPYDPGAGLLVTDDDGIQRIKLIIKNNDNNVLVLENFKVDR
ncbi:MAG: prepilin-type N-terminal cleavage/methylation domain-containing protein [Dehalococcoidia bacterium]|nr:MAG: prepilin-type N-terminal cleavage/methylation domain-containing protein [Dehalococcoidia bacterium]